MKKIKNNIERNNFKNIRDIPNERKMRPTEWAVEDKLDPALFVYWKDNLITKSEFNELKKQVM